MKRTFWTVIGVLGLGLALPFVGGAYQKPARQQLPNFDRRLQAAPRQLAPDANRDFEIALLQERVAGARVDMDVTLGTPKFIGSTAGFLTGPDGSGGGVVPLVAQAFPGEDPHRAVKAFLQSYPALFGAGADALAEARITREYVTPHNGMRTVVWSQQLNGVSVYARVLIANISEKGELINISSQFLPSLRQAANAGTPNWEVLLANPAVSAAQAAVQASPFVDAAVVPGQIAALGGPHGAEQRQELAAPPFSGPAYLKLVWLPMGRNALRLCWEVILVSRARGEGFRVLVDANTGDVVLRENLTSYISPITLNVYTSDSPSPLSPGHPTPLTNQPPLVSRNLLTLSALSTNASPNGWIDDGNNETVGNNVDAHTDRNNDDAPDLPRPQGSPSRVFDFTLDLNQAPTVSSNAAVVQLFYWNNFIHDRLYELGFTEAAGNFQTTNFNRGGVGNDPVQADAQDGGGTDNANMTVFPDGLSPRMQMYLWTGPNPARDGSLDAELVIHEYVHGLSVRRVGGGVGIFELQTRGMGEGWSDFYAFALLSEPLDDVDATYATFAYAGYQIAGLPFEQNYYYGIRRYPYTTDMQRNPLTFKDIDPTQAIPHTGIPRNPIFGPFNPANSDEVHNQGEVWCAALWEVRANLIKKWGYAIGNDLIMRLVIDGMGLSPGNPNFIQARDAIIQADLVNNSGANFSEIWRGFAKRGMGFSATSPSSSTTVGVVEAFDIPSMVVSMTVSDVILAEGNSGITNAQFVVSLGGPSTNTVTVSYATSNITAVAGADYFSALGTLSFPPGVTTQVVAVAVLGDVLVEANEVFALVLQSPTNAFLSKTNGVCTILNDDGPVFVVSDVTITEGDSGITNAVFNVGLSQPGFASVTFVTADGTAVAGLDYFPTNGTLFFSPGLTNQTVLVPIIGEGLAETNETFSLLLTNSGGASIFKNVGAGLILDDDSLVSVLDTAVVEGNTGTTSAVFNVRLNKPNTNAVSVRYSTASFSAGVGSDFVATSGTLVFTAGVTNLTVSVPVNGDLLNETDEVFLLNISSPTNTFIVRSQASCVITNDDPLPGVSIVSAVSATEGSAGTSNALVSVSLTSASGQIVRVAYATAVGTASPGSDYVASSGVLVFPTNTTSRVVSIPVMGDSNYEGNETFTVRISNPSNATNVTSQDISTVTIVDDDPVPLIGVSDVSLFEGNSGTTTAVFTVTLSVSSGLPVTVNYATSDLSPAAGAASGGTDYVSASGTVTFPPGSTSQTVSVTVNGDVLEESNEAFFLDLSGASNAIIARNRGFGTILNDDGPILQISDVTLVEGNSGTTNAIFTVTLLPADDGTVTVLYATSNVTATAGLDYLATNGSLSFGPGQTSTNITVVVNGETFLESDETFAVVLSSATNATIGRAVGTGTIKDDDTLADLELAVTRSSLVGSGLTNFVGHHLTYFITVTNRGPLPSTNVVVTNLLPASFAIVSWTNSQGTFSGGSGSAVFSVGTLVSNAGFAASLVVAPSTTGSLTNFVSVLGQQPDPNPLNNTTNLPSDIITPQVTLTGGAGLSLVAEGVQPPNGSFDAAEFVTVALTLQNLGNVAATNVSVSLLSGTGVHAPSGAQSYGALTTNLPTARQFNFTANTAGGDVITTFVITDGTNSMGTVSFTNRTGSSSASANTASVSIPAFGAAATYPSVINVSGLAGVVNKVSVTLSNLSHSWPADLDVLLVGPAGQSVLLLSDAGGGNNPVSGVALAFDDAAASPLVEFGPIATGAYKPSNYDASDSFPAPAPAAPYGSQLSVFNGTDPNGAWSLFIVDDANGDLGSLAGGWSLRIETAAPVNTTAALAVSLSATPDPVRVGSNLVYTITVTNRGPGAATSVVLSNILPFQAVLVAAPAFTQGTVITNSEGILVASLGKILSGASVDGVISVINQAAGTATNIVTVAGNETDANPADNLAVNVTRINRVVALASQSTTTLTNGQFGLTLSGAAGLTYVIEVSTNLVHWTPIFTNPPGGGTVNFVDTNAAAGLRFYRAVER